MCGDKIKMLEESHETCVQNDSSSQKNIDGMFPRKHSSKFIPTCHHCGVINHIQPNCFQLNSKTIGSSNVKLSDSSVMSHLMHLSRQLKEVNEKLASCSHDNSKGCSRMPSKCFQSEKQMFTKKEDVSCFVFHTALNVIDSCLWYLHSACSKHMAGNKDFFKELKEGINGGNITYGDGSKSKVIGKGVVEIPSVPILEEVLFVDGLKANLLSISQFCDDDLVI